MKYRSQMLDVMVVIETQKVIHAAHPTEATKPLPRHVEDALEAEDVTSCVGKAQLAEDGTLHIQLRAIPVDGRLLIRLPG